METYTVPIEKIGINHKAREWCRLPYPGHPNGCPNYGKALCPPVVGTIEEEFNLDAPLYFCVIRFDMAGHMAAMKAKHPHWTEKQTRNCLYWQGTVRAQLQTYVGREAARLNCSKVTLIPEAMGVHVILTAKRHGIPIDIKARDTVHKIALIGSRLSIYSNQLELFPKGVIHG